MVVKLEKFVFFRPRAVGRIWQTANIASGNTVVVVGTMCTSSLRPYKTGKILPNPRGFPWRRSKGYEKQQGRTGEASSHVEIFKN